MKETVCEGLIILGAVLFTSGLAASACAGDLDEKVKSFLESHTIYFLKSVSALSRSSSLIQILRYKTWCPSH